jgi:hypothetical protein
MALLRHARQAELTQAKQLLAMSKYPQFRTKCVRNKEIKWVGDWQPEELSPRYSLEITYTQGLRPRIAVLKPVLALGPGHTQLPHVFDGQRSICVHTADEWSPRMLIADTILPWISQWLVFYEAWALTGVRVATEQKTYTRNPSGAADAQPSGQIASIRCVL